MYLQSCRICLLPQRRGFRLFAGDIAYNTLVFESFLRLVSASYLHLCLCKASHYAYVRFERPLNPLVYDLRTYEGSPSLDFVTMSTILAYPMM